MLVARTARLAIEPLAHAHAAALVDALAHESVAAYLPGPDVTTIEALHARIDRLALGAPGELWLNFVIRRADDGVVIGRLEATSYGAWAEIAYLVGPAYQRRGFAREAVRWLVGQLCAAGAREIWAAVHPANAPSIALLAALGFVETEPVRPLGSYDSGDRVFRAW
jgi:RimJ/RimL family protein N-acetyltransferase